MESLLAASSELILWSSSFFLVTQDIDQIISTSTFDKMVFYRGVVGGVAENIFSYCLKLKLQIMSSI